MTIIILLFKHKSIRSFRSFILMWFARFINAINFNLHIGKKNEPKESFKTPCVIISNHISVVDISLVLSIIPKLVIVANSNLMHSKFIWLLKQYAYFFEMTNNINKGLIELKQMQKQGYSILIFPEGMRSQNKILRFHKGAFMIAEKLNMDILPLLIKADGDFIDKNSFFKHTGKIQLNVLPRIIPDNKDYGDNYSERAKKICQYYRAQSANLQMN